MTSKNCILILMIAAVAPLSGFVIHVFVSEGLPGWIASQMDGVSLKSSWSVRYLGAITSIEYGIGALAIYILARDRLLRVGKLWACITYAILLACISGAFLRQPLMDFIIGNPLIVVLVQNGFIFMTWLIMSAVIVFGYEYLIAQQNS